MKIGDEPPDWELGTKIARARYLSKNMHPLCAREMYYNDKEDAFFLRLFSGVTVTVHRALLPRFDALAPSDLRGAHLAPDGNAIVVNVTVEYSVSGILRIISGMAE